MSLSSGADNNVPLCVDLDDTLLKTDLLFETVVLLARKHPLSLLALPYWLCRGRAWLKRQVALRVQPDVPRLPFRRDLLEFLAEAKKRGRRLVLVSAADQMMADQVNAHLRLFDVTIGSNGRTNLKSFQKAELLVNRYGLRQFDYIGDSHSDLAIWRVARRAFVVSDRQPFIDAVSKLAPVERTFPKFASRTGSLLRALRIYQWPKNLLIFVPVITGHRILDPDPMLRGLVGFIAFSVICSGVYLLNDLIDLEADRAHETKRMRSLAAGDLSIKAAATLAVSVLALGLVLSWKASAAFFVIVVIYIIANLTYSTWFKRVIMLDVVILASFYTLRLLAGGAVTRIECSEWLLAFSIFFFFCLAMVKRFSELRGLNVTNESLLGGRGYRRSDLEIVANFGAGSGLISVLVLVLYVMSPEVRILYRHPTVLLLLCPLLLYWITRIWFKAQRGEVPEDPVVFALSDRISYVAGILAAIVLYGATV